ncbi:MAG: hypothetical protein HYU67_04830 [Flavobacteriia bacterium]|nr:hypothetical protein [Flavobacteriia bacterium]
MKNIYLTLVLFFSLVLLLSSTISEPGDPAFNARINTYKHECKQLIKPARYEGSRVTFYTASKNSQKKSIETYFLMDTEYRIAFSGKESSVKLNVEIYTSMDPEKRVLLKEIKNLQGKNTSVSSIELNKVFHKKVNQTDRLKSVYIEYKIEGGNEKNEAIVMVLGFMD